MTEEMQRLRNGLDTIVRESLRNVSFFTIDPPMLGKARTIYLAQLAELSSIAEMEEPLNHLYGMARRMKADYEGQDVPELEDFSDQNHPMWSDPAVLAVAIKSTVVLMIEAALIACGFPREQA